MEKKVLLILMLLTANMRLYGAVNISGSLDKNDNWIPKLSPYVIEGTVTVEKKGFLTIHPGTEVRFREGAKLIVKGALYAKGDPKNPVRFIPDDGESFYEGIVFESRYKNTLEFCIMIRGAVTSLGTPVIISNSYILNSTGVLLNAFADAVITNNYFYNNTYGVYVEGKNAKFTAKGNTFNRNRFAIYLKEIEKDGAVITGNNFVENKVSLTNYTPDDVMAKDNYWGTDEDLKIKRLIFDRKNNQKVGEVVYSPFKKNKLAIYEPPDAFISLVKLYMNLKRPDEQPMRVSFGAGGDYYYLLSPDWIKSELEMGYGMRAEFTFNITGALKAGIEAELLTGSGTNSLYDFNLNISQFLATFYAYLGYKKNIYFIPYAKAGMGIGLISAEYKSISGAPLIELGGRISDKYNEVNYSLFGGFGAEYFITRFMSVKAEALYNCTTSRRGAVMFPLGNLTLSFYFDTPFFLNVK